MQSKLPTSAILCVVLMLTLSCLSANALAQDENYLEVADYLDFEQVNDAQISPDGSQIVYTRRWVDQKLDRWSSALWIMDADGLNRASTPRRLDKPRFYFCTENKSASSRSQLRMTWSLTGADDSLRLIMRNRCPSAVTL